MSASSQAPVPPAPPGLSPRDFLLRTPRGAYTTLWVRRCADSSDASASASASSHAALAGLELVDWGTHLERLARSLRAMHTALDGAYARYYSWLEASGLDETAALQQLAAPSVKAALVAAVQAEAAAQHLMLILVLPPAPHQPCGLAVHSLAASCGAPGSAAPGAAVVLGGPRTVPVGKDSGWVAQRAPLELLRPPGAAEVLLCTAEGRLLEGLVTNLFLVVDEGAGSESHSGGSSGSAGSGEGGSDEAASGSAATRAAPRLAVWTAGMHDGVVWGTARARVLEACRRLGYATQQEAPATAGRHAWREAFLTNSLRLVQPLRSIQCGAGNVWGLPPWEVTFDAAPGPVTTALAAAVAADLPACRASDLSY